MGQAMVQHAAAAAGGAAAAAGSKKVADGLEKILGGAANTTATAAGTAQPKTQAATPVAPVAAQTGKRAKRSPFEPQVSRNGGSDLTPTVAGPVRPSIPSPAEVESGTALSGESGSNSSWVPRRSHPQQGPVPAFTPFVTNDAPAPAAASRGMRRTIGPMAAPPAQMAEAVIAVEATVAIPVVARPIVPPPPPPPTATLAKLTAIQKGATYEQILASLGKPASKIEMIEDGKVLENLRIESRGNKLGTIRMVDGVVTAVEPVEQ